MKNVLLITSATIMTFGIMSESWAEFISCINGVREDGITACDKCGSNCDWSFDSSSGKLSISGSGKMTDYDSSIEFYAPWQSENIYSGIKEVYVGDGITSVGSNAFLDAENLTKVTGMKDVTKVGDAAFYGAGKLESIETPSATSIEAMAFYGTGLIGVDLPVLLQTGDLPFAYTKIQYINIPANAEICNPDCHLITNDGFEEGLLSPDVPAAALYKSGKCSTTDGKVTCGSCGNQYVKSGSGCVADCGSGLLGKNGKCISATEGCGTGYKKIENWCNRIRYTPAEAAAAAKDNNTNVVTLTFKK